MLRKVGHRRSTHFNHNNPVKKEEDRVNVHLIDGSPVVLMYGYERAAHKLVHELSEAGGYFGPKQPD